ncbi:hypothetical protein [Aliidiomarina quisquiliarum]|uniref:hypothetical protein n=1 Tax=Aliidiomarina quisquiliarum TaxID=2938947 RepID=UPI00208E7123|nr:hypothetical protein [Aliidiomarina quisquiliarum]MCO4321115.1 hypothetical protein [Aliidiomarina quisquiliarum]
MLTELLGKKVKVFLNCTQWNEYAVSGTAIKIDGNWLYLKTKKATEIISMPEIKRVTVFD